jgi:hypothetical protein
MTDLGPLHQEHPVEYPEGAPSLDEDEAQALDAQVDRGWQRDGTSRLSREFAFGDFRDAYGFATRVALLAEREFHHPELTVSGERSSSRSGPIPSRGCPATTSSSLRRSTGSNSVQHPAGYRRIDHALSPDPRGGGMPNG